MLECELFKQCTKIRSRPLFVHLIISGCILLSTLTSKSYSCIIINFYYAATVNEDYLEFEMNITFVSGQNSTGDNQQCFYIVLLDDNVLEYNETFDILIRPSPEDEDIVNITGGIITVTIDEDPTDSKQKRKNNVVMYIYNYPSCGQYYTSSLVPRPH